ncbi:MAG: hypothetical protein LBV41_05850 [Cytophagaceae bacterium]|jgi:AraC-like DNA-binding protein|nr:hypothetical protein [Cytophagaceae bacterium]
MENAITFMNWREKFENSDVDAIGNDFILFEKNLLQPAPCHPCRIDATFVITCTKGSMECFINLKHVKAVAPCFIVFLPDQIVEHKSASDDFEGYRIIMSKNFGNSLLPNGHEQLKLYLSLRHKPVINLNREELKVIIASYNMLKKNIRAKENTYSMEVARHLTLALFYGTGFSILKQNNDKKLTHYEILTEKFIQLVQTHYKQLRNIEFYANKLCLTSKHLTRVIKETTGKTANGWIDERMILEAKALLKSTDMVVRQIF